MKTLQYIDRSCHLEQFLEKKMNPYFCNRETFFISFADEDKCSLFPLSEAFKKLCGEIEKEFPKWNMSTYALRLAAQETR